MKRRGLPCLSPFILLGRAEPERGHGPRLANFFDVLGVRPAFGRTFINQDDGAPLTGRVKILSAGIRGGGEQWAAIVCVVADTLQRLNEPAHDEVYSPILQSSLLSTTWLPRTNVDPHVMERQVKNAVHAIDPNQPVDHFRTVRRCARRPSRLRQGISLVLIGLAIGMAGARAHASTDDAALRRRAERCADIPGRIDGPRGRRRRRVARPGPARRDRGSDGGATSRARILHRHRLCSALPGWL